MFTYQWIIRIVCLHSRNVFKVTQKYCNMNLSSIAHIILNAIDLFLCLFPWLYWNDDISISSVRLISGGSVVKNPPPMQATQETWVHSLGWKDPLATHSSILAWKDPWTEELGGLVSVKLQNSWTQLSKWTCTHVHTHTHTHTHTPDYHLRDIYD